MLNFSSEIRLLVEAIFDWVRLGPPGLGREI